MLFIFEHSVRFCGKTNFPETLFDDDDIQAHRAVRLEAARGPVWMAALAKIQPALEPYPGHAFESCIHPSVKSEAYCFIFTPAMLKYRSQITATLVAAQHAK